MFPQSFVSRPSVRLVKINEGKYMKKISLVAVMMFVISGCGREVLLSDVFDDASINPPTIEQANARMISTDSRVEVSDSDCEAGVCNVTAYFLNEGGKLAHGFQYKFNIQSDDLIGVNIDYADESTEPSEAGKVILKLSYFPSISLGKLGTIELNYAMNSKGDREKVTVEVVKIH